MRQNAKVDSSRESLKVYLHQNEHTVQHNGAAIEI